MRRPDAHELTLAAWVVSLIATVGSLSYSGVGAIGWYGLGLLPCELCWYQRIIMYPLTGILGYACFRRDDGARRIAFGFAVIGAVVALYHSLIQYLPRLEIGQCTVGSCTFIQYRVLGLSIPNQALLAFVLIAVAMWWVGRNRAPAQES